MTLNITQRACAATLWTLAACDADVQPRVSYTEPGSAPTSEENGVLLNSFRLNSFRLNSFRLNSFRLNGDPGTTDYIEIAEVDLPGKASAKYSWVEGSDLHIKTTWGQVLDGSELEGAVFAFTVQEDGVKLRREVRVADVSALKKGSDVLLYDLEIREQSSKPHTSKWGKWWWGQHDDGDDFGDWEPLCVDSDGDAVPAILLTDIWDPDTGAKVSPRPTGAVTFACVDAALGKCAVWGYRPWATVKGEPLADYHQACTRMARADYCGDGDSHTDEGTPIHVLDELGIEKLDVDLDFAVEAEWAPDGAVCLNPANTRLPDPDLACELPTCGAKDFSSGGLIQSGTLLDWP